MMTVRFIGNEKRIWERETMEGVATIVPIFGQKAFASWIPWDVL